MSIPFDFECDLAAGFISNPNEHKRIGYLLSLDGFGLSAPLATDLVLRLPYNAAKPSYAGFTDAVLNWVETAVDDVEKDLGIAPSFPTPTTPGGMVKAVGVIKTFSWKGGTGEPLIFEFYCSQQNAQQIKALQVLTLKTTAVKSLAYWIGDYDQETKAWYEQAYPLTDSGAISGIINGKEAPQLEVDLTPVQVAPGIDVNVYKVRISIVCGANARYNLFFANSYRMNLVKLWGVVVGTLAQTALSPVAPLAK